MNQDTFLIRKSFGLKEKVRPILEASYHSALIEKIKEAGYTYQRGRVRIRLAKEFGFCYGVHRAIDYAYETKWRFPDRRIFLTNEIIHNPQVNAQLEKLGIQFLRKNYESPLPIDGLDAQDVVIIPAFGATVKELEMLKAKGCVLVDTTCGSVMSVWKRVEAYSREGFTAIIHGKYEHEETQATSSRALQYPGGQYLIVRDKVQAAKVCDYIEGRGNREEFLKTFVHAVSSGFDPDKHLGRIGCANQTTMLSSESLEIANMLEQAIRNRYGEAEVPKRFRHFDTICSATQDRQDAVYDLVRQGVDLMLVIGGYNSSNTGHLVEISSRFCPAYHIKGKECLIDRKRIEHKDVKTHAVVETEDWLPAGNITVGVTAGASTPNRVIEDVILRLLELAA